MVIPPATPPATPPTTPPPLQLSSEAGMVWNLHRTEPFIPEVDVVHPLVISSSMVSLKSDFYSILTRITANSATRETDHAYSDTRSMARSVSMTNTTVSSHDLQEAAETTANNSEAIYDLWRIAERMRSDGYVSECIQVYKTVRKAFLNTNLQLFGIEKQSTIEIQNLFSKELEERIKNCVRACYASCSILFPAEMELCTQIFEGSERDMCYSATIQDTLVQVIDCADSLICARRLPELLFKYLDLHEALVYMWSTPRYLRTKYWADSVDQHIINDLVDKIRCTLSDFEKSVIDEMSTGITAKKGGEIAFLTIYVMDYLTRIAGDCDILTELIVTKPDFTSLGGSEEIPDLEYAQDAGRSPLELHVLYIVVLLRFKIESKCKYYYQAADSAESYLFLTNNLAHIVQSIRQSPILEDIIGISYMNKLKNNYLKQVMVKYQQKTCDNMLQCLRNNGVRRCFPGSVITAITFKRKITSFYSMFEEARLNQGRWVVLLAELQLQEEHSVSVAEELVIAYTTFLERFNKGRSRDQTVTDNQVKYLPHQIQTLIANDFFRI